MRITLLAPLPDPVRPSWLPTSASWSTSGTTVTVVVPIADVNDVWIDWPGSAGDPAGPWRCLGMVEEPAP